MASLNGFELTCLCPLTTHVIAICLSTVLTYLVEALVLAASMIIAHL